jgi:hypothetical protein
LIGPRGADMRRCLAAIATLALAGGVGCDAGKTKSLGAAFCSGTPAPPPAALGYDAFYGKYLDGDGVPVLSSPAVDDQAVVDACQIVVHMLSFRGDVRQRMTELNMSVAIIGVNEVTTQIPEYRNLNTMFPMQNWDRLRGVGATIQIPVSSVGEENLLCLSGDPYAGESVVVQTFSSAILLGVENVETSYKNRLQDAYTSATNAGLWQHTFAQMTPIAYFGAGVQDWFDAARQADPPDGVDNYVNTKDELQQYDPTLAGLVAEVMPDTPWHPICP